MSTPSIATPEGAPGGIAPVRLPADPVRVFERRATRFRMLAAGHTIGEYLLALASLAEAQRLACRGISIVAGEDGSSSAFPLRLEAGRRGKAWREALGVVLAEMGKVLLPTPARRALTRLGTSAPSELEDFADALLDGKLNGTDAAVAPFVGAALQVYWTRLASEVPAAGVAPSLHICPVCGSPPVAGTVAGDDKLRYLTCSLCAAEWHLTRVMCATCGATGGISYFAVEGNPGAVKAEACEQCGTYLKLFYLEQDTRAEPIADDTASLSLDLLMAERGFSRGGVNFFLYSGVDA
jgi:FdhE protein